jgi:hypothetical protein
VALGIPVVWVNRKCELLSEDAVRPDLEVRSLCELADVLCD